MCLSSRDFDVTSMFASKIERPGIYSAGVETLINRDRYFAR
jgi:hypothetical protein